MNEEHYPNVFYVGPSAEQMVLEPIHLGLWNLADVRTFWVHPGKIDRMRSTLTRDFQSSRAQNRVLLLRKKFLVMLSRLASRYSGKVVLNGSNSAEPDLIFVADVYKKIKTLNNFSCPKAYYVQDPQISLKRYFDLANIEDYDYIFVTQKNAIEKFRDKGYKNVAWLPWAFDPATILGPVGERDIDISFIGNPYPGSEREALLLFLEQKFKVLRSRVYLRDMAAILRRSKIVFNKSLAGDLNPRNFEAMGAGALLVTDRIDNGLSDLFQERVHLLTYRDKQELEETINYFLRHKDEREAIAWSGEKEVLSRHTYLNRAAEILRVCLGTDLTSIVERRLRWVRWKDKS